MKEIKQNSFKTADIAYIAVFASIISICAWISVPTAIPFTLQTFGVFLSILILGGKRGTAAVAVYLLMGAVGAPVFAGFSGGIGHLISPTGGYLIGFLFAALMMWLAENVALKTKRECRVISMVISMLICYIFGTAWFVIVYAKNAGEIGIATVLAWCVLPYIIPDAIKILMAYSVSKRIKKRIII